MKKRIINIILIIVMISSIVGIAITINHAKDNLIRNNPPQMREMGGTPPEMNNGNKGEAPNGKAPMNMNNQSNKLTTNYKIIIGVFSGLFSISLIYLLMSLKNPKFYTNKDKIIICILGNIILIIGLTFGITTLSNNLLLNNNQFKQEETEKDKAVLDESNVVSEGNINLDKENTDVTIKPGGTYTFSGSFTHSIIIDAEDEDVKIVLNGVEITNKETATIIGLSANKITIDLADNSNNKLTDGGNSEYDGCIFSNAELIFEGNGTLEVNGKQNEGEGIATEAQNITFNSGTYIVTSNDDGINAGGDGATITFNGGSFYINASGDGIDSNKNVIINDGTIFVIGSDIGGDSGIDTDDGYIINGGKVVALGSDMIETPKETSKQKVIAFSLDNAINKETTVTLVKNDEAIVSFEAPKGFKTIIISSNKLDNGEYLLYAGGSNSGKLVNGIYENGEFTKGNTVTVNNSSTFNVSKTINLFGKSNR